MPSTKITKAKAKATTWKITKADLDQQAEQARTEGSDVNDMFESAEARFDQLKTSLLVPFACNLVQAERTGIIEQVLPYLLSRGFRSTQDKTHVGAKRMKVSAESMARYASDARTWLNAGAARDKVESIPVRNLHQGAPKVKFNLTQDGRVKAPFVKAAATVPTGEFSKRCDKGTYGEKDKIKSKNAKGANRKKAPIKADLDQIKEWVSRLGKTNDGLDACLELRKHLNKVIPLTRKVINKQAV